jgi:sulfite reductase (NADPH) flavoprotein alpha-component
MSSWPIPGTAPFAAEDIETLNRVVAPATPVQRAWLAGFLAGLDAAAAVPGTASLASAGAMHAASAPQPAAPAQPAEPLTIVYATESGNSERLASDMAKLARKMNLKPTLIDMADLEMADLAKAKRLVFIAATWGEGDPPGRAVRAYGELMGEAAPRLEGVQFGVLALGDTAYADFCGIGKKIDARLEELGGKRIADRVDCDLDFEEPAGKWIDSALKALAPAQDAASSRVIAVDFGGKPAAAENLGPVEAEIIELVDLNSSQSDKETYHLELAFQGAAPAYKPGDSLDLYSENDPA